MDCKPTLHPSQRCSSEVHMQATRSAERHPTHMHAKIIDAWVRPGSRTDVIAAHGVNDVRGQGTRSVSSVGGQGSAMYVICTPLDDCPAAGY